ncbi:Oidioi.mRNA.OKI2018_I69.PAR.g11307.t1.cds [Oikopleura dioica]|uniref:Oidioi.mRNA.OKI2018_I69.PAR.g11307.t1.cds n=1 Tax=Oikopleura dioica TaxID=34765 RepID=A0ABN7RVS1_OIKDI|nr:Oidioi.mRNA.OKI2018_I69.PAR.g11307.t1.cds [Oikopleura dioica]
MTVECTANRHCSDCRFSGAKKVCDKTSKRCVDVECLRNNDCGERAICEEQSCVAVECEKNSHCGMREICSYNKCRAVECVSDMECGENEFCNSDKRCQPEN